MQLQDNFTHYLVIFAFNVKVYFLSNYYIKFFIHRASFLSDYSVICSVLYFIFLFYYFFFYITPNQINMIVPTWIYINLQRSQKVKKEQLFYLYIDFITCSISILQSCYNPSLNLFSRLRVFYFVIKDGAKYF